MADYYKTLGVEKTASDDEIKKAYRKLAMKYHPDKFSNASDSEKKSAEDKFKEINRAYSVLSDSQKKSNYDQFGNEDGFGAGAGGAGGWHTATSGAGFDFEDIFSNIFNDFTGRSRGGKSRASRAVDGEDIILSLNLTFKEAAFGCKKEVKIKRYETCSACNGTGAKNGSAYKTCPHCNGTGHVNSFQNTPFGRISTSQTCRHCNGTGKVITDKCSQCNGKGYEVKSRLINVKIPAGISEGRQLTYHGEGHCGKNGGANGNVIILIKVAADKLFTRQGYDLHLELPISMIQATLGCVIHVPTLKEPIKYTIPEATQTNTIFRIKGSGIKYLQSEQYGDLYFKVVVDTPKGLSLKQKRLLTELESTFSEKQYAKVKKYHDTLKSQK